MSGGVQATATTDVGEVGRRNLVAVIFDVDGVLLASPHERAWREALQGLADPARFTTELYQEHVAGKPRLTGARDALEALGAPDADRQAAPYAQRKQIRLEDLIAAKDFHVFEDALRLVRAVDGLGWPMAAASSSKNANGMLRLIPYDRDRTLYDVFAANVCGRDLPRGKPDPAIFLLAATELGLSPSDCLVVEDAPAGIKAAHAGGMTALGIARLHDADDLRAAGADMVVDSLDDVSRADLAVGRLSREVVRSRSPNTIVRR